MTDRYSYESIIKRKAEIMRQSTGIDYSKYEKVCFPSITKAL